MQLGRQKFLLVVDFNIGKWNDSNWREDNAGWEEDSVAEAVCPVPDAFQHLVIVHIVRPSHQSRERHPNTNKPEWYT